MVLRLYSVSWQHLLSFMVFGWSFLAAMRLLWAAGPVGRDTSSTILRDDWAETSYAYIFTLDRDFFLQTFSRASCYNELSETHLGKK